MTSHQPSHVAERCLSTTDEAAALELTAKDCMSSPVVTVMAEAPLEDCCRMMEQNQVRRIPVVDEQGDCCGIVSQADIARVASEKVTGKVVREVSRELSTPSRVGH